MNTTIRREAQIDTEIAAAWHAAGEAAQRAEHRRRRADDYLSRKPEHRNPQTLARYEAEADEYLAEARWLQKILEEQEARYEGWSRFFLVPGGHIHSSMHCSTCNRNNTATRFGWLPELSGLTEADAVETHGAILCTVCFPSAPVEWTNAFEEAAKAKAAARCAGSGSFLNRDLPHRTGYYSGNYGTCEVCGDRPAVTSTGKLRAHKPKA